MALPRIQLQECDIIQVGVIPPCKQVGKPETLIGIKPGDGVGFVSHRIVASHGEWEFCTPYTRECDGAEIDHSRLSVGEELVDE